MLSINIPVYNYEVSDLVIQLVAQAKELEIQYEIRIYDDCSREEIKMNNRMIMGTPQVVYLEMKNNLGRAAIRNKMGFESQFEYLLFLDADSLLIDKNYLKKYFENLKSNLILCGGTVYNEEKPAQQEKYLRWFYGTNREAIPAEIRNSKKGFILTSNNFLIEKRVFEKVHFREEIKKYGHEDTLLGFDLYRKGLEIFHIDNPVEHTGLENSLVFIEKTKAALENLHKITYDLLSGDLIFIEQVNFLNQYKRIEKHVLIKLLWLFYKISHRFIERNLTGNKPSLFYLDLYKLGYYATLK